MLRFQFSNCSGLGCGLSCRSAAYAANQHMSEIYFVRHGQASLGAADYDQLSPLGWQQARWLGEYFRAGGLRFDRAISGDLRRHRETVTGIAEGMGESLDSSIDAGFNEFTFRPLMKVYAQHRGGDGTISLQPDIFFQELHATLQAWMTGELDAAVAVAGTMNESWQQFEQRVGAALGAIQGGSEGERLLIVSSGGPTGLAMKQVLGLSDRTAVELMLQVRNTSVTRFYCDRERITLAAFNVLSHLDSADRRHAVTLV